MKPIERLGHLLGAGLLLTACAVVPAPPESEHNPYIVLEDLGRWDNVTVEVQSRIAASISNSLPEFEYVRLEHCLCAGVARNVAIYKHLMTGMEFVLAPCGTFEMGSGVAESGHVDSETQHRVTLTTPFLISRTPVTRSVWAQVVDGKSTIADGDLPECGVTLQSAQLFCSRAGLELPTEAEWEWACRAGTLSPWYFGSDANEAAQFAWFADNSGGAVHPVGMLNANAFGLYDMVGNVYQWCSDGYEIYDTSLAVDPVGSMGSMYRVVRGGCAVTPVLLLRSACRGYDPPGMVDPFQGLRVVRRLRLPRSMSR